jgi:hypothetical protein
VVTWNSDAHRTDAGDDTISLLAGLGPPEQTFTRLGLARVMASAIRTRLSQTGHGYNPNEPRDWHGRWTTGGNGQVSPAVGYRRATPIPTGPVGARRGLLDKESFGPSAGGRLYGGQIIRIEDVPEIGHNGPPEEETPENEPLIGAPGVAQGQPFIGAPQVPQGWDIPGQLIGGLLYPTTRHPVLRDGSPWPVATHDAIKALLTPQRGKDPKLNIYIPYDGIGPTLLGSTATASFAQPDGYDLVTLIGTPQVTHSQGFETGHANDSIDEALSLAKTHQFSKIYFNLSLSKATDKMVQSLIRPDVLAVARPPLDELFGYQPYESFSPRQDEITRQNQLSIFPGLAQVYGRSPSEWRGPNKK